MIRHFGHSGVRAYSGYTLLEVMVALFIVSISLGAVFQNLSVSKKSSIRSEKAYTAVRLANNIFHDIETINRVVRGEIIEQKISGRQKWYYRFSSKPLVVDSLSDDDTPLEIDKLKKLTLCILYGKGQKKQSFCFVKWRNP